MTKQEKITYRILASLYPDRRPSEIRKIINDALAKEERMDDMELWMALTRETAEKKETKVEQPSTDKIIERHYYHDGWCKPYWTTTTIGTADNIDISCADLNAATISSSDVTLNNSITYTAGILATEMN